MITDSFILDCCRLPISSERLELNALAMTEMAAAYGPLYHEAVKDIVFGKDKNVNKLAKLNFLMVYLDLILEQEQTGTLTAEEKIAKYCIKNIEHAFRCAGIDIRPALKVYGLYPYASNQDGIDFMIIEGTTDPQFIVREWHS